MVNNTLIKDYKLYVISYFLRYTCIGVFFAIFNLYILSIDMPVSFLGTFLAIGNISMAIFSYLSGIIIDKYSKKKLLIIFSIITGILFLTQATIQKQYILYLISFGYGFSFITLINLNGPILMSFTKKNEKMNYFMRIKSFNLLALMSGSIIAGFLVETLNFSYQNVLILTATIYIGSAIPAMFMSDEINDKAMDEHNEKDLENNLEVTNSKIKISIFLLYFIFGFTVMLLPYVNIYLNKVLLLDELKIGTILAWIYFAGFIINYFFSKYVKNHFLNKVIITLIIFITISYISLMYTKGLAIQIIILTAIFSSFSMLTSSLENYILIRTKEGNYGKVSGIINTSYNIGDSISTYIAGVFAVSLRFDSIILLTALIFIVMFFLYITIIYKKNSS